MDYLDIVEGVFLKRLNRFIARVKIDGLEVNAHVKNTGRLRELLVPGATIYLVDHKSSMRNTSRKTRYSLILARKDDHLVNLDSSASNHLVYQALMENEWILPELIGPYQSVRAEVRYGRSRLDFFVVDGEGKEAYVEVKTVTLEEEGIARFPGSPTLRGIRHLEELEDAVKKGYHAMILFVIQLSGIKWFEPNDEIHASFSSALRRAKANGVHVVARQCNVSVNHIGLDSIVPIRLGSDSE